MTCNLLNPCQASCLQNRMQNLFVYCEATQDVLCLRLLGMPMTKTHVQRVQIIGGQMSANFELNLHRFAKSTHIIFLCAVFMN